MQEALLYVPCNSSHVSRSSLFFWCLDIPDPLVSVVYVPSPRRPKGQCADLPDGGQKKPPSQLVDASSGRTSDDPAVTPPHHCEMTASRLPTLPEEETCDFKSPHPAAMIREEADGKDDAAEVNMLILMNETFGAHEPAF